MAVENDWADRTGAGRVERRRASIAAGWRPDPKLEAMRALLASDPERFDRTYGARHRISVGLYVNAGRAAGAITDDGGDAA